MLTDIVLSRFSFLMPEKLVQRPQIRPHCPQAESGRHYIIDPAPISGTSNSSADLGSSMDVTRIRASWTWHCQYLGLNSFHALTGPLSSMNCLSNHRLSKGTET